MAVISTLLREELHRLRQTHTFKVETALESAQAGSVTVDGKKVVMLASNNYLGLSDHPRIKAAAIRAIEEFGHGVASVRFLCGTQTIHLELEKKIAAFVGADDAILFSSCFSANEGLFASIINEPLGSKEWRDVVYSDRLNHASIIDGMRLCSPAHTVKRIYNHKDTEDLERLLTEDASEDFRFRIIATDGVFSMEGDMAPLKKLVDLAERFDAILVVDDSHALGVLGSTGRGTAEALGVHGKIHVQTGTLGKAMGGAIGGYVAGKADLIEYLRQKSRPYTFSNSIPPSAVLAAIEAITLLEEDTSIVASLHDNTEYFRVQIAQLGYTTIPGQHPIVPIMLGEAPITMTMSEELLKAGVYIKGLWFPVVPKGEARLRAQISAAHTKTDLDRALEAFAKVGKTQAVI